MHEQVKISYTYGDIVAYPIYREGGGGGRGAKRATRRLLVSRVFNIPLIICTDIVERIGTRVKKKHL